MIKSRIQTLNKPDGIVAAAWRPIAPDDLLRFRLLHSPQISPDGNRIVFVEKRAAARNEYATNLWIVDIPAVKKAARATGNDRRANGSAKNRTGLLPAPRQLTQGNQDREPRWSPDGTRLAFIRAVSPVQNDLFLIAADGGEARRLTQFPEGAIRTLLWSPDGRQLAVSFRPRDRQWSEQARKERAAAGASDPPQIVECLWYRLDGEGPAVGDRRRLYLVDAESGVYREIFGGDVLGNFSFDFSPNSRQLVVSTNRSLEPTLEPWKDELLRIDTATGRATAIRGLPWGPKTAVSWSPDGRTIAFAGRAGKGPYYSHENLELFVCSAAGGRVRSLTGEHDFCLQTECVTDTGVGSGGPMLHFGPAGREVYFRLGLRGESHAASVPMRGGPITFLTRGGWEVAPGNLSADGRKMALAVASATSLPEIAVLDCLMEKGTGPIFRNGPPGASHKLEQSHFPLRMLTNLNGPLLEELDLATPREMWIRAADGHSVQAWCLLPPGTSHGTSPGANGRKLPAVLEIHGGPHAQYGAAFFHEFQVLAAAGYAVFYSNPRGSKGYGRDHCAAIHGRWGTDDWTDIQAVIGAMKSHPAVDPRRMGVIGGSYGGYMTNWAIGHCHDFAAAVTDRSLCNLVSFSGNTDFVEPPGDYFPGNFWDQAGARWEQSPLKHLGNCRTPTLVIHSEGDLRCNIEQAEELFAALKLLGVPARFVRYPRNTSHAMSRSGPPDLRIHRLHEILRWWQKYLKSAKRRRR